jgi:hypothetical protein
LNIGQRYLLSWDQRLLDSYSGSGFGKSFDVFLGPDGGTALLTNEYLNTTWKTMTATFVASASSQLFTFAAELTSAPSASYCAPTFRTRSTTSAWLKCRNRHRWPWPAWALAWQPCSPAAASKRKPNRSPARDHDAARVAPGGIFYACR